MLKRWAHESRLYTSGGITFTYPTEPSNWFSSIPLINIGIQLNNTVYSTNLIISHMVTSNTITSCTVRVNSGNLLGMSEALSGSVRIHFRAYEL